MKVLANDMNLLSWGLHIERKGGTSKKKDEAIVQALHNKCLKGWTNNVKSY